MNFRFTKAKTIISICVSFFLGWILTGIIVCMGGGFCFPKLNWELAIGLMLGIIPGIMIYSIWSLFQKE